MISRQKTEGGLVCYSLTEIKISLPYLPELPTTLNSKQEVNVINAKSALHFHHNLEANI